MNAARANARLVDVTWIVLVALTFSMYFVDQRVAAEASGALPILSMAIAKCLLVGAVFMGLLRASRVALALHCATFVALGVALIAALIS